MTPTKNKTEVQKNLKILIADKLSPNIDAIFTARGISVERKLGLTGDALAKKLGEVDAVVIRSGIELASGTLMRMKELKPAAKLRVIGRAGIGVDNIHLEKASELGIVVLNTPFGNAVTTAEHTISMLLAAARHIPQASALLHQGIWNKSAFKGMEVMGKTLGVVGSGNIGSLVIERALGMKMKVIISDPFVTEERAQELHARKVSWEDLLQEADCITFHVPLTDKTRNLLDEAAIKMTKQGVIIVNCSRGGVVDEQALKIGLESGHIGAAALDVFCEEPLSVDHPLRDVPRLTLTPHLGASTREAQERVGVQIAEQMSDFLLSGEVRHAVNTFSLTARETVELAPYILLAEKLALFIASMVVSAPRSVTLTLSGEASALKGEPLLASVLYGLYKKSIESINLINAPAVAKAHGVHTEIIKSDAESLYHSLIHIYVRTEKYQYQIAGTLLGGESRVVRLQESTISAEIQKHHLYIINEDKPGFITSVAKLLSEQAININSFHLASNGQSENTAEQDQGQGKQAAALITVDAPLKEELVASIKKLPLVTKATYVAL